MSSRVRRVRACVVVVCRAADGGGEGEAQTVRSGMRYHSRRRAKRKLRTRFDPGKLMPLEISHSDVLTRHARRATPSACTLTLEQAQ